MKTSGISTTSVSTVPTLPPRFTITQSGKKVELHVEQAFSLAHRLMTRGNLESATTILNWLESVLPGDRRIKVLHARCEARQKHFAECKSLLGEAFPREQALNEVQDALCDIIVSCTVGIASEGERELNELCKKHPTLPSLWLFVGDQWVTRKSLNRAEACWKVAIAADKHAPKLVATAAKERIHELKGRRPPAKTL